MARFDSGKPPSPFQNGTSIATHVKDRQNDYHLAMKEEKDRIGEIREVKAPDVRITHGVTKRVGQK
jgi:hypothetical protein